MRVENGTRDVEPFAGVVAFDRYGVVSAEEQERLAQALALNSRLAARRDGYRDEYLNAEAKIGANIRDRRTEQGMSQERLATLMGNFGFEMHQTTVAKIESGKRPLRIAELFAFADALDLPWMALIEGGRDIDIVPVKGMLPVDAWEVEMEELHYKREDVMSELVEMVTRAAKRYAEWDRMMLIRVAALANAAATARRGDVDEQRVDALLRKWNDEAAAWSASQDAMEKHPERIKELHERTEAQLAEHRALVAEFAAWRASRGQDGERQEAP